MSDLIERYIHQVGRYLPPKERVEIEAELRSQIADQLDDRFQGMVTPEDVQSVLAEWGHPQQIAASYREAQYLIGPQLYPFMMAILGYGWLIVLPLVWFLGVFGALNVGQSPSLTSLLLEPILAALSASFIFSGVVVFLFALLERAGVRWDAKREAFNPAELPEIDDPRTVDRFELSSGISFGTIVMLLMLYWLRAGGLSLPFNLTAPTDVLPVSSVWLSFLILNFASYIGLVLWLLRRNRWSVGTWLLGTALETLGIFGMYFVLYQPLFLHFSSLHPDLASLPVVANLPELLVVITAFITLAGRADRLVKLFNYRASP